MEILTLFDGRKVWFPIAAWHTALSTLLLRSGKLVIKLTFFLPSLYETFYEDLVAKKTAKVSLVVPIKLDQEIAGKAYLKI